MPFRASLAGLVWGKPVGSLGRALELCMETRSVAKTIRQLRAKVSQAGFYKWIKKAQLPVREVKKPDLETKLRRRAPLL